MPRNGTGTYALPAGNPVAGGTAISETWANTTLADIATALTNSLAADGQTVLAADFAFAGFKATGLADGAAVGDAATVGQVQAGAHSVLGSVAGTAAAYTATLPLSVTSFTNGQIVVFVPDETNSGAASLAVNGGTARTITRPDGSELVAGDLMAGVPVLLIWKSADNTWRPASGMAALTAAVVTALALKANIADPTFTTKITTPAITLGATALTATGAQINAACVTYPPSSGVYTPTLTNTTNITASTASACQYIRVGSVVTVSGKVNIDAQDPGAVVMKMSLPVASNPATDGQLAGVGWSSSSGTPMVRIKADATANNASFEFTAAAAGAADTHFTFTYLIV